MENRFYFVMKGLPNNSNGRILKANLSWSRTRAKFCQLISNLFVVLSQLNLTKLEF